MNKILQTIIFVFALSIPLFAISVINPPSVGGGSGSGDVVGPASNNDTYVPQWDGADSLTLANGFPISAQGKTFVNLSSTANMRNNLGLNNHQLLTASSTGLSVSGTVTANTGILGTISVTNTSNLTGRVKTTTIQAASSQGINVLCSNGDLIAQFDGGGSCQITSPLLIATVSVTTQTLKARTSGGLALQDDGGNTGLVVNDGGKIRINTTGTQGQLNVSGDVRVTGNIYVSGVKVPTTRTIAFGIDGGTSVPSTGNLQATYVVPVSQTILNWYISADATGNAVLDIKRSGTSIIGAGNKPTLSSAISNNAAAANWTSTALTLGDRLVFVLDSIATAKAVTVILKTKEQ